MKSKAYHGLRRFLFLLVTQSIFRNGHGFTAHSPRYRLRAEAPVYAASLELDALDVDVVLFGVGDYRIADHVGLCRSLGSQEGNVILPLVLLDTADTLPNIPMAHTHPTETASILFACLTSLDHELQDKLGMRLHVHHTLNNAHGQQDTVRLVDLLNQVLQLAAEQFTASTSTGSNFNIIRIHVCDLGMADTNMKYNPYAILKQHYVNFNDGGTCTHNNIQLFPWNCTLTSKAWDQVLTEPNTFPDRFDLYQQFFLEKDILQTSPIVSISSNIHREYPTIPNLTSNIPSLDDMTRLFLNMTHFGAHKQPTGLYMTHWGGFNIQQTLHEAGVHELVHSFLDISTNNNNKRGDDTLIDIHHSLIQSNVQSLEHASIARLIKRETHQENIHTDNLIQGEILTRFLAAPLLFGIISYRQLWHLATQTKYLHHRSSKDWIRAKSIEEHVTFLKRFAHDREWYLLLATKNILSKTCSSSRQVYKYWRWHGFLCRYSLQDLHHPIITTSLNKDPNITIQKNALIMIHGFGASGSQFNKTTQSLAKNLIPSISTTDTTVLVAAAPDLLGFGQSEKPCLTYTQYL